MFDLSDHEFSQFQRFIYEAAGISLAASKKPLVASRLSKRVAERRLRGFGAYFKLLTNDSEQAEVQRAIDLLTTNETYFFREPKHFEVLRSCARLVDRPHGQRFRVWSAASSSGEEAYSMAMVLEDCLGADAWEVLGTDISTRVLARAERGQYDTSRATGIPPAYLKRFCLRGVNEQEGTVLIDSYLRSKVQFCAANLNATLPKGLGTFDAIFLRNVLIYFNDETKRQVVTRVLAQLKVGGHFFIGHSETLHGVCNAVTALAPSVYRKG